MPEYIEREAARDAIFENEFDVFEWGGKFGYTDETIVRCKDCKYAANAQWNKKGYRICPASHMEITDDDFCSYGERREAK